MTNGWLMDIDDAIMVLDNEKECVRAANYCDKECRVRAGASRCSDPDGL